MAEQQPVVIQTIFKFKRGEKERWEELNPILEQGEPGFELNTGRFKIGDGSTEWKNLPYQDKVITVNTLSDLPLVGEPSSLYKINTERTLYQWNVVNSTYVPLDNNVDEKIKKAIEDATGGTKTSTVLEALDEFKSALKAEIWGKDISDEDIASTVSRLDTVQNATESISKSVEDLALSLRDIYTKEETDTAIAVAVNNSTHLKKQIVEELPSPDEAKEDVIYMILNTDAAGNDKYKEYMLIAGSVVLIGDTSTDLTNYATKEALKQVEEKIPTEVGDKNVLEGITLGGKETLIVDKKVDIPLAIFNQDTQESTIGLIKPTKEFNISEGKVMKISTDLLDNGELTLVFDCGTSSI